MKKSVVCCRIICLLLVVMVLFLFGGTALAQTSLEDVAKSVVQIVWELPDRPPWNDPVQGFGPGNERMITMGSGFLLGTEHGQEFRWVVTNWHVVDVQSVINDLNLPDPWRFTANEINIYLFRARDDFVPLSITYALQDSDIAFLEIPPFERGLFGYVPLEFADPATVQRGDDVWAVGFPGDATVITDRVSAYYTDATITKGIVSRLTSFRGVPCFEMDTSLSWGNSGGPLVNEHGQIIGINTRREPGEQRLTYAVRIDTVTGHLRSRGIPFLEAGATPAPDPAPTPAPDPPPVAQLDPGTAQGFNPLWIGLAAAAVLIIVLAVVLARGKKPAPAAAVPSASPQPAPAPPTQRASAPATQAKPGAAAPVTRAKSVLPKTGVKGISGHFAGQTVELVEGQLVIGRDPRLAQLVYPQSSDEISRKHVTIRFEEKTRKFVLEDSSSNGTYLSSNQKLETGKPYYLNPGERFYVADPKEVFELVME